MNNYKKILSLVLLSSIFSKVTIASEVKARPTINPYSSLRLRVDPAYKNFFDKTITSLASEDKKEKLETFINEFKRISEGQQQLSNDFIQAMYLKEALEESDDNYIENYFYYKRINEELNTDLLKDLDNCIYIHDAYKILYLIFHFMDKSIAEKAAVEIATFNNYDPTRNSRVTLRNNFNTVWANAVNEFYNSNYSDLEKAPSSDLKLSEIIIKIDSTIGSSLNRLIAETIAPSYTKWRMATYKSVEKMFKTAKLFGELVEKVSNNSYEDNKDTLREIAKLLQLNKLIDKITDEPSSKIINEIKNKLIDRSEDIINAIFEAIEKDTEVLSIVIPVGEEKAS